MRGVNAARQMFYLDCMGEIAGGVEFDFPDRPAPSPRRVIVDER